MSTATETSSYVDDWGVTVNLRPRNDSAPASEPAAAARSQPRPHRLAYGLGTAVGLAAGALIRLKRQALNLLGLGCLTAAAWQLGTGWGLAATGVSLLLLDALSGSRAGDSDAQA